MLNDFELQGRLTREVELKYLDSGTPVAEFSIACERNYKNRQGERDVDFFNCEFIGKGGEIFAKYFGKGDMTIIDGSIKQNRWENEDGKHSRVVMNVDNFYFPGSNSKNKNGTMSKSEQDDFDKEFDDNFDVDDVDVPF